MIDSSKLESSIEKHFTVLSLRIQSQIPRQPENFQFRFLPMHILGYPVVVSIEGSRTPLKALPGTIVKRYRKRIAEIRAPVLIYVFHWKIWEVSHY